MEREPQHRYQSASAMKKELDAPESVKIRGRPRRLQSSKIRGISRPKAGRIFLWTILPLALLAGALCLTRCHGIGP
jgi:hypothetical protein